MLLGTTIFIYNIYCYYFNVTGQILFMVLLYEGQFLGHEKCWWVIAWESRRCVCYGRSIKLSLGTYQRAIQASNWDQCYPLALRIPYMSPYCLWYDSGFRLASIFGCSDSANIKLNIVYAEMLKYIKANKAMIYIITSRSKRRGVDGFNSLKSVKAWDKVLKSWLLWASVCHNVKKKIINYRKCKEKMWHH